MGNKSGIGAGHEMRYCEDCNDFTVVTPNNTCNICGTAFDIETQSKPEKKCKWEKTCVIYKKGGCRYTEKTCRYAK